jgi:branched-chain amino acid transport system permease protein
MLNTILSLTISGVFLASIYILVGLGISILYGVSQTINLAQGDFMILGAYLTFLSVSSLGIAPIWTLSIVPFVLAFLAMMLYKGAGFSSILRRPISREDREFTTLIMTFALSWIVSNILAWVFTANLQTYPSPTGSLIIGEVSIPFRKFISILVSFLFLAAIWFIIKYTWIGLSIRCVFNDNEATKLMGVNVEKVHFIIFFLAFFSAGLGGVLYSMNFAMNPYLGPELTILAIVVAIIGGIGSVKGVMIAGTLVGLSESFVMFFISPLLKIAFVYSLFHHC